MDNNLSQMRKMMQPKDSGYIGKLRGLNKLQAPEPELAQEDLGFDESELSEDIKALKKDGYSIDEVNDAIDGLDEIKNKPKAKQIASSVFQEKEFDESKEANLIIVRHGTTHTNKDNRLRAWMDIPLSPEGKKEVEVTAKKLKSEDVDIIITADLTRAEETADIISKATGAEVKKNNAFRPWHLGELTGNEVEKSLPIIDDYARNKPDQQIPGGESFNEFKKRFLDGIEKVEKEYPGRNVVIVTHHRGERLLAAWTAKGEPKSLDVDLDVFLQKGIEPGEFREENEDIETAGPQEEAKT